jgi:hypothetical protein
MIDQFKVQYHIHPSSDDGHRYKLVMDIWDENGNFYRTIPIGEYATFDRALEIQDFLFRAAYKKGEAWPWE